MESSCVRTMLNILLPVGYKKITTSATKPTIIRTLILISDNPDQDVEEVKEWCSANHIDSRPISHHKLVNHILNID